MQDNRGLGKGSMWQHGESFDICRGISCTDEFIIELSILVYAEVIWMP